MTHLDFTWERREELIRKEEYEEGEATGIRKGIEQGRVFGQAEFILDILSETFAVPEELRTRILAERNSDTLRKWHKIAIKSESLEQFCKESNLI